MQREALRRQGERLLSLIDGATPKQDSCRASVAWNSVRSCRQHMRASRLGVSSNGDSKTD
jgi:hypothetical protein